MAQLKEGSITKKSTGDKVIATLEDIKGVKGDKVTFEGKVYESLIDGNSWSPSDYASSWKEIKEV